MFVSIPHQIVFVAIPKTATRSIYYILKEQYGGSLYKEHWQVIPEEYKSYFSFCIVRNPYDRACSAYWSTCRRSPGVDRYGYKKWFSAHGLKNTLENFLMAVSQEDFTPKVSHGLPQYMFIEPNRIDRILRIETLNEEWNSLPFVTTPMELPHANSTTILTEKNKNMSVRPPWQEMMSPKAIELINTLYTKDFKLLNYEMIQ